MMSETENLRRSIIEDDEVLDYLSENLNKSSTYVLEANIIDNVLHQTIRDDINYIAMIEVSDTRKPRVYVNPLLLDSHNTLLKEFFESSKFSTKSPIDKMGMFKEHGIDLNVIIPDKEGDNVHTTIMSQIISYTEKEYMEITDQMKIQIDENKELLESLELPLEDIEICLQFLSTRNQCEEIEGKENNKEFIKELLAGYQRKKHTLSSLNSVRGFYVD